MASCANLERGLPTGVRHGPKRPAPPAVKVFRVHSNAQGSLFVVANATTLCVLAEASQATQGKNYYMTQNMNIYVYHPRTLQKTTHPLDGPLTHNHSQAIREECESIIFLYY